MVSSTQTFLFILIWSLMASCNGQNVDKPIQKSDSASVSQENPKLNVHSKEDCINFLKGKIFYGDKARIEFHYDNNAYIYSKTDNNPLFTGYVSVDQTMGTESRIVRVHDTFGSEQVIILLLKENESLIDMSDYALYQAR